MWRWPWHASRWRCLVGFCCSTGTTALRFQAFSHGRSGSSSGMTFPYAPCDMPAQKDAHQGTRGEGGDFWVGIHMQSGLARTTVNKQCIPPRAGRGSMGLEELNGRKNWVCLQ
ncbi:hypothetical protein BDP67DRAFT_519631 [Colletotrichum lupini]|nr:hypothetical protein BDP67DRAFT_519631 [Colletotrichum lupini]